jgi:hypothetical protein
MKKTALFFLTVTLLTACRKNPSNPEDLRLLKLKFTDSALTNTNYLSFEYDADGRIAKLLSSTNNNTPVTIADISYTANKIIITTPAIHNAALDAVDAIEYTVDGDNRPVQRIQNHFNEFKAPTNLPQRDFTADTALYEYDGSGLLIKITGRKRDSTWFNPGSVQTTTDSWQYSTVYMNTGGNVQKIVKTSQKNSRLISGSTVLNNSYTIDETHLFEYTHSYQNKTDFTNALVLTEFGLLSDIAYPLNKNYKNFPDKISYSAITKNAVTGAVIDSNGWSENITLGFNVFSLISSIDHGSNNSKIDLIYNR